MYSVKNTTASDTICGRFDSSTEMTKLFVSTRCLQGGQERHHSSGRIGHSEDVGVGRSVDNSSSEPAQRCRPAEMEVAHTPVLASSSSCVFPCYETPAILNVNKCTGVYIPLYIV